jgi:hypothetical protein
MKRAKTRERIPFHVDDRFIPVGADVVKAITFHKKILKTKPRGDSELANAWKLERNAFLAVCHAHPRNLKEAAERLAYVDAYYHKNGDGKDGRAWLHILIDAMLRRIAEAA